MFDERVILPEQLPIKEKQRKVTDCCCTIVGAIFALTMFIVACCMWNRGSFEQLYARNVATNGRPCPEGQFMHLPDYNDYQSRICVKQCPQNFIGSPEGICTPVDEELRNKYTSNPENTRTLDNKGFKLTLLFAFIIAIGWGLLRMTLTHCLPRIMPIISFVIAILFLIFFGVFAFVTAVVSKSLAGLTIPFGVILIILAVILLVMLCLYINEIKFQGYMLEYATKFHNENPQTFLYIPVFILFHIGLFALALWQHSCYSSFYRGSNKFWNFGSNGIFDILNIIQYLWGLRFLRDAFNFCVSGNAVDWYWTRHASCYQPYQRLVCKNWGSVVGGSFLNLFFGVPTLIMELFICHPNTACSKLGTMCYNSCNFITCFFELIRTDAYSYINLTGIPFCDAARQCAKLCDRSNQFVGYHSAMKHYRFAAHIQSVAFVFFWGFWILNARTYHYDIWQVIILIIVIFGTITWFVGIHTDAAQGLQTSYLAQLQLEGEHQYMQKILPSMRKVLQPHQNRVLGDGNF